MKFTTINLLEELDKPEFSTLLTKFRNKTFPANSIIFEPTYDDTLTLSGPLSAAETTIPHPSQERYSPLYNYVFIVRSGRIRVYLAYEEKQFTVALLQPGDVYVSHSSAFVATLEESSILLIPTSDFFGLMKSVPQFSMAVIKVLGGILKNSFTIIDGLALRDASGRLARFLLENVHENKHQQDLIELNLTGEFLAQILGTSRQTISTLLTDFVRSGILHKERRGVYRILDKERLHELIV